jgi:DNA-binding response OmpR family regulator
MKLLIVDDDSFICSSLTRGLIRLGHAGRAASSVEQALKVAESEAPAAILTDLDLGAGGDGIDLIQRLRENGCRVPMILMTGGDPVMARARLARVGLDEVAFLAKPFGFDELMKVLAEMSGAASTPPAPPSRATRPTPVADLVGNVVRSLGGRVA